MRASFTITIAVVLLWVACNKKEKFRGFTETDDGVFYKLNSFSESKRKPQAGEYLDIQMTFATEKDSVFIDTRHNFDLGKYVAKAGEQCFVGSFEAYFMHMNEGDSVSFMVSSDSVCAKYFQIEMPSFIKKGSFIIVHTKLNKIMNEAEYAGFVKQLKEYKTDLDIEEQRALSEYVHTHQIQASPASSGLYYISLNEGTGAPVERGKRVTIRYKGFFLDGTQFDNLYEQNPLEFTIGDEDQVIKGIETGLSLMKEGGKAKFIIPSQLAFGEEGSSTRIVPPYTTVVYELELLSVK